MIKRKILASITDSSKYYLGIADLLLRYKIPAVFYISPGMSELSDSQIKCLIGEGHCTFSKDLKELFEIGASTMTYPENLTKLDNEELMKEIAGSKAYLERITGKPITKFCYPNGKFDDRVKGKVRLAGFKEARTEALLSAVFPGDLFEINPTIQVHPLKKEYGDRTWIEIGYELFDNVIQSGGRFEIYGNAYEIIEKYNMKEFFEEFLSYIDERLKRVKYERKI